MRKIIEKHFRDNLEVQINNLFRGYFPHYQFEHRLRRLPLYPKIVVYSNVASVDRFFEQVFPTFKVLNPKLSNETDEVLVKQIATELIKPQDTGYNGVIVNGFPFSSSQALLLDYYLKGVNLAVHLRGGDGVQDFSSLLSYYRDKGSLVEVDYKEKITQEDLKNYHLKFNSSIKRVL